MLISQLVANEKWKSPSRGVGRRCFVLFLVTFLGSLCLLAVSAEQVTEQKSTTHRFLSGDSANSSEEVAEILKPRTNRHKSSSESDNNKKPGVTKIAREIMDVLKDRKHVTGGSDRSKGLYPKELRERVFDKLNAKGTKRDKKAFDKALERLEDKDAIKINKHGRVKLVVSMDSSQSKSGGKKKKKKKIRVADHDDVYGGGPISDSEEDAKDDDDTDAENKAADSDDVGDSMPVEGDGDAEGGDEVESKPVDDEESEGSSGAASEEEANGETDEGNNNVQDDTASDQGDDGTIADSDPSDSDGAAGSDRTGDADEDDSAEVTQVGSDANDSPSVDTDSDGTDEVSAGIVLENADDSPGSIADDPQDDQKEGDMSDTTEDSLKDDPEDDVKDTADKDVDTPTDDDSTPDDTASKETIPGGLDSDGDDISDLEEEENRADPNKPDGPNGEVDSNLEEEESNQRGGFNGNSCESDEECIAKACVEGICSDLRNVGESCDSDSDCLNEACGAASLSPGSNKICCPTGSRLQDICTGQEDGALCVVTSPNRQGATDSNILHTICASGFCNKDGICGNQDVGGDGGQEDNEADSKAREFPQQNATETDSIEEVDIASTEDGRSCDTGCRVGASVGSVAAVGAIAAVVAKKRKKEDDGEGNEGEQV